MEIGSFEYIRKSRDKTLNGRVKQRVKKLLEVFENNDMIVLKGRSKSDPEGGYTFVSNQGRSVVDYCVATSACVEYIEDFKVEVEHFSDHMPLTFRLRVAGQGEDRGNPLLPRLTWRREELDEYKKRLSRLVGEGVPEQEIERESDRLISYIKTAARYNPQGRLNKKE